MAFQAIPKPTPDTTEIRTSSTGVIWLPIASFGADQDGIRSSGVCQAAQAGDDDTPRQAAGHGLVKASRQVQEPTPQAAAMLAQRCSRSSGKPKPGRSRRAGPLTRL